MNTPIGLLDDKQVAWVLGCCSSKLRGHIRNRERILTRKTYRGDDVHRDAIVSRLDHSIEFARETIALLTFELEHRGRHDLVEDKKNEEEE